MKTKPTGQLNHSHRQSERGAALLMTLLVATLLLSAGLGVVMTTTLSATTAVDSTAEMQAYFGAEAGIEATLNVFRGNVAPHASLAGTRINFRNAARPATSDRTIDTWATGSTATARLSGWLDYSYQPSANNWRVPVTPAYNPLTGIAFKIVITDPDDPGPIDTRKITTDASYKPRRLIIRSEGFGPKGAVKRLEMIVNISAYDVPGAITLQCGPSATVDLGDAGGSIYRGNDMAVPPGSGKPALTTCPPAVANSQTEIDSLSAGQVTPNVATALTAANTPGFLESADNARAFLSQMRAYATSTGRLFPTQAAALATGDLGTPANPKVTFIDNYGTAAIPGPIVDLGSGHQGSGLLIVTGEVATNGNTDFEGVILVLGRGIITRSGGGNGVIRGGVVIAAFDPNGAPGTGFGTPTFTMSGGGTSTVGYDSNWVRDALAMTGGSPVGIREYH